jgi:proteasome lid subunit RPN8/RPN11
MAIHLTPLHYQAIATWAITCYPQECCGLLVGQRRPLATAKAPDPSATLDHDRQEDDRQVENVIAVENAWTPACLDLTDPAASEDSHGQRDRYWIDPTVMLGVQKQARQQQLEIIGIFHSHPDHPAVPSECDRALAWPVYSYIILSVVAGQIADCQSWRLNQQQRFQPEPVKILRSSTNNIPFLS